MPLQNFIDKVTLVTAAWLNQIDAFVNTVFGGASTPVAARTALFTDNPLEVTNGGTGLRDGTLLAQGTIRIVSSVDVALFLNANGATDFFGAFLQLNTNNNLRLKNNTSTGSGTLILGAGTVNGGDLFEITRSGAALFWGQSANAFVDMAPDTAIVTLTPSPTDFSAPAPATTTAFFAKNGNLVTVTVLVFTATSISTGFNLTGAIPAAFVPARTQNPICNFLIDNGIPTYGSVHISATQLTFFKASNPTAAAWTGSAVKGFAANITFSYGLN